MENTEIDIPKNQEIHQAFSALNQLIGSVSLNRDEGYARDGFAQVVYDALIEAYPLEEADEEAA